MAAEFYDLPQVTPALSDQILIGRNQSGHQSTVSGLVQLLAGNGGLLQVCAARETHPNGQNGGYFPPNVWYTRPLNEREGIGSLSSGAISLPAGDYLFYGYAIAMQIRSHQTRLLTSTGGLITGSSGYSAHANSSLSIVGPGIINLNSGDSVRLQHRCSRDLNKTWGLGYRANFDNNTETYAGLFLLKI